MVAVRIGPKLGVPLLVVVATVSACGSTHSAALTDHLKIDLTRITAGQSANATFVIDNPGRYQPDQGMRARI
jgi:hypothetical protein